jgi:hypothetical protein
MREEETKSRLAALGLKHEQRAGRNHGQSLTAGFKTARMASSKTDFRPLRFRAEHSTYLCAAPPQTVTTARTIATARVQPREAHL